MRLRQLNRGPSSPIRTLLVLGLAVLPPLLAGIRAQTGDPQLLAPNLSLTPVVTGLALPTSMAFLGPGAQFREIETTFGGQNLQQVRWPPTNIATSPDEALSRLFMLPGATYSDPEFSWKWEVAPAGLGFVSGRALGPQYDGDLFLGAATANLEGGYLFHFNLTGNGRAVAVDDPRLGDRVADNLAKHDITESESLLFGRNFGIVTDIETGPNGNLFVLSLSRGTIYEITRSR